MDRSNKRLSAMAFLSAIFMANAASAMQITRFDRMSGPDQADYVVFLIEAAQKLLIDQSQSDLAARVHKLFTEVPPGDDGPTGMTEFALNLAKMRLLDLERIAKDPKATRLEVEHAMILSLKKNGIVLPQSFMHAADKFRPKSPVR